MQTVRKNIAYGLVSKGNGEAWLIPEKHMTLAIGGGQAGQGYPCVLITDETSDRSGCVEHEPDPRCRQMP